MLRELGLGLQIGRTLPCRHLLILYVLHALLVELYLIEEAFRAALSLRPGQRRVHTGGVLDLIHACDRGAHHLLLMVRRYRSLMEVLFRACVDSHVVGAGVRQVDVLHLVHVEVPP